MHIVRKMGRSLNCIFTYRLMDSHINELNNVGITMDESQK